MSTEPTVMDKGYPYKDVTDYKNVLESNKEVTIKELTTGTSGLSLAQLVATRAAMQMLTLMDARKLCRTENVPERGGMVYHFQKAVVVPFTGGTGSTDVLDESTDLNTTDITLTDVTVTLQTFAGRTDVSDIAMRQAAVNFSQLIGAAHGNALVRSLNNDIYTSVKTAGSTAYVQTGSAGDATETTLAWSHIFSARQKILSQRGMPTDFITSPKKLYELIQSNVTSVQFYASLQDFIKEGTLPRIMGMRVSEDPVWGETFTGTSAEVYGAVLWGGEAVGFCLADDVHTEVQRWAPRVGARIVSSVAGKSVLIMSP